MIAICVTNDVTYDQRMQRIAKSIAHHTTEKIIIIGRRFDTDIIQNQEGYSISRYKCHFNTGILFYLEYNIRLFFMLLKTKPSIVYACDPDTLIGAGLYKLIFRKKGVYDSHEYYIETPEINHRPIIKSLWKYLEKFMTPRFDLFLTVNEDLAEILTVNLSNTFISIRNLPSLGSPIELQSNKENIIIYQGVLNKGRGLESAINMMEFLPNYKLWLIGAGDVTKDLIDLKSSKNYRSNIIFFGKKTPLELIHLTKQAKYGLNLLEGQSLNYYYSLANKFFDYMKFGVPSINMDFPVYKRYCAKYKCGITVKSLNPQSIANFIKQLDHNPIDYAKLCQNALKAHKELNWENEEIRLIREIKKLL